MTIASGTWTNGDLGSGTWRIEDDGSLYVEGTGAMQDYSETNSPIYSNRTSVTSLTVGEGITHIGGASFYGCSNMTSASLPSTLESIGGTVPGSYGAFASCTNLTEITLPDGLTTLGNGTFMNCRGLTSINLNKVVTLGQSVFIHCVSLEQGLDLKNVQSMGSSCFGYCSKITEVTFSGSITTIPVRAFESCGKLTKVTLSDSITIIDIYAFQGCGGITTLDLKNVVTIKDSTFEYCDSIVDIVIPETVTSIGSSAFVTSKNITRTFTFLGSKPTFGTRAVGFYGSGSSYSTNKNVTAYTTGFGVSDGFYASKCFLLRFGDNITYTYENGTLRLNGSGEMATVESDVLPSDVSTVTKLYIDPNITVNMTTLTNVFSTVSLLSIPSVTNIADSQFISSTFKNLTSIDISGAVTIGKNAFSGCPLRSIKLGSSLTTIGAGAFKSNGCQSITVPESVTSIGAGAFTPVAGYRQHMVIVFRGTFISGTATAPNGMMIHQFCANSSENYSINDYASGVVNSSRPIMMRAPSGWRVIDTIMIDYT